MSDSTNPASYTYTIIRQDSFTDVITLVDSVGDPIDIAAIYDDVILEVRTAQDPNAKRKLNRQLSKETITLQNVNELVVDLTNNIEGGKYFYDVKFKYLGMDKWQTFVSGPFIITDNVSNTV